MMKLRPYISNWNTYPLYLRLLALLAVVCYLAGIGIVVFGLIRVIQVLINSAQIDMDTFFIPFVLRMVGLALLSFIPVAVGTGLVVLFANELRKLGAK